jgi:hypothetical protein
VAPVHGRGARGLVILRHREPPGRDHRHVGTRAQDRESSAGVARCTACPDRVTCVPGSHITRAFTEYRSAGAVSCHAPRGDQRSVRTPSRGREQIPVREGWKDRPTPGEPCPRVPPFRRPTGRATRREATGARLGRLPPTDLPRPAYPAAVDAAARAALPPTAPPPASAQHAAELGIHRGTGSL